MSWSFQPISDPLFTNTDPDKVEEYLHYCTIDDRDALLYQAEQFAQGRNEYKKTIIKMFQYDFDHVAALPYLTRILHALPNVRNYINNVNYEAILANHSDRDYISAFIPTVDVIAPTLFDCAHNALAVESAKSYSRAMARTAVNTCLKYGSSRNLQYIRGNLYFQEAMSVPAVLMTAIERRFYRFVGVVAPLHLKLLPHILETVTDEDMHETISNVIKEYKN